MCIYIHSVCVFVRQLIMWPAWPFQLLISKFFVLSFLRARGSCVSFTFGVWCELIGEKSSRGLLQWVRVESCTDALVCGNHAQLQNPGMWKPSIAVWIKLATAAHLAEAKNWVQSSMLLELSQIHNYYKIVNLSVQLLVMYLLGIIIKPLNRGAWCYTESLIWNHRIAFAELTSNVKMATPLTNKNRGVTMWNERNQVMEKLL
jgi:hypothetical protein